MNLYEKEHAELHKKIWNCSCMPLPMGTMPCNICRSEILDFLMKYGAGVLTNDLKIEDLKNKNSKLEKENITLNKRLQDKIKRVEELKESSPHS